MAQKRTKRENQPTGPVAKGPTSTKLIADLRELIEAARATVAQAVNAALVALYWQVGTRIRSDVLHNRRAGYGEKILPTLSAILVPEYGQGFSERNLARMIRFAECFPDRDVVGALSPRLGWSHFVEILQLKDQLQRDFYAEMCRVERWSVRTLRARVEGCFSSERPSQRKPAELAQKEIACAVLFRRQAHPRPRLSRPVSPRFPGPTRLSRQWFLQAFHEPAQALQSLACVCDLVRVFQPPRYPIF